MKLPLLMMLAAGLSAQTIQIKSLDAATPLKGEWREQRGDDPRYADPGFDDSSWTRVMMPRPVAPGAYGYTWHRIHLEMSQSDCPLLIAIAPQFPAYEIFANGVKIGSFGGNLGEATGQHFVRPQKFLLPKGQSKLVIAIRSSDLGMTFGRQISESILSGTSWLGSEGGIALKLAEINLIQQKSANWLRVLCAGLGIGGLFFVMLSLTRQGDREFLWCGLLLLAAMMNRLYQIPDALAIQSRSVVSVLNFISQSIFIVCWILLLSSLFKRRASLWVWGTAAAAILGQLLVPLETISEWIRIHSAQTRPLNGILMALSYPLTYFLLGLWRRDRTKSEWFTHATLLTYLATNSYSNISGVFDQRSLNLNGQQAEALSLSYTLLRFPILLMFFAMGLVLNKRKAEAEWEQARLQQELSAAAQVQTLLLPGVVTEGVEATYLPASEVGGDFYQAFQTQDGARIAIVGDVSGKGLKAAMLVSVAIGAIEREKSLMPDKILERLNLALIDRTGGGFVTCCCVRIESSGRAWVASAGHPAPYWRGQEIEFDAGLPLGVVREAAYQSHEFEVEPGDQLTIVSDGGLEAANEKGELFGFERTRAISHEPAVEIAEAARAWGQNDDITVVSVRRNA